MVTIKIYDNRLVCPRCEGNGFLYRKIIEGTSDYIIVCDECEATWTNWKDIWGIHKDLRTYLEEHRINFDKIDKSTLDYLWFRDTDLNVSNTYYECLLLNMLIWMGDCCDINMVRNKLIKQQLLVKLENEIGKKIDLEKANYICESCTYGM